MLCDEVIEFIGPYWRHTISNPRHIATLKPGTLRRKDQTPTFNSDDAACAYLAAYAQSKGANVFSKTFPCNGEECVAFVFIGPHAAALAAMVKDLVERSMDHGT
jgi:hypothetical protein